MRPIGSLVAVAACAAIAGCGGDDSSGTLTRAELIARGDALCADFRAHTPSEIRAKTYPELERKAAAAADLQRDFLRRLKALKAPPDGEAILERFAAWERHVIDLTEDVSDAAAK